MQNFWPATKRKSSKDHADLHALEGEAIILFTFYFFSLTHPLCLRSQDCPDFHLHFTLRTSLFPWPAPAYKKL